MKKSLLTLALLVCVAGAFAQRGGARGATGATGATGAAAAPGGFQRQPNREAQWVKDHYTKTEAMIPMRDGVKLFASIYTPKDQSVKYPIIMQRTPYNSGPYPLDQYKTSLGQDTVLSREGFIFVYTDVRGRYMSEGEFVNVRPQIQNKPTAMAKPADKAAVRAPAPIGKAPQSATPPIDESTD